MQMARSNWTWMVVGLLLCSAVHAGAKLNTNFLDAEWRNINDISKLLEIAVHLPLHSQKTILKRCGEAFAKLGEGRCNIFGGHSSCVSIPSDSDYVKVCPQAKKEVDCAFELAALEHITKDPESHFRERLSREGYAECPECYKVMHQFWCAQTVPACGTFEKVIDEILPLVTSVALKKEKAQMALRQAVPRMLQAASLGLPCKQMCDVVTQTCGCSQATNFGEVFMSLQSGNHRDYYNTNMSLSTAKDIFHHVWDKPVCDLFADKNMPGFAGVCELPESTVSCSWCKGNSARPKFVHEQIVAQMAQIMSGLMQGGLEEVLTAAGGEKSQGGSGWSWAQSGGGDKKKGGGHAGVWAVLVILMFVATGAFVAAVRLHHNRQNLSQYVDLNSMGYTAPIL